MKRKANNLQMVTYAIILVMVLALVLSFTKVSDFVGAQLKMTGDTVNGIARTVLGSTIGLFLISSGVAALAIPVAGIALIAVGIVILLFAVWPAMFASKS